MFAFHNVWVAFDSFWVIQLSHKMRKERKGQHTYLLWNLRRTQRKRGCQHEGSDQEHKKNRILIKRKEESFQSILKHQIVQ